MQISKVRNNAVNYENTIAPFYEYFIPATNLPINSPATSCQFPALGNCFSPPRDDRIVTEEIMWWCPRQDDGQMEISMDCTGCGGTIHWSHWISETRIKQSETCSSWVALDSIHLPVQSVPIWAAAATTITVTISQSVNGLLQLHFTTRATQNVAVVFVPPLRLQIHVIQCHDDCSESMTALRCDRRKAHPIPRTDNDKRFCS